MAQRRENGTELIDAQREPLLNRELAARVNAGPVGRSSGASLRTVSFVLASTVCYYVATQIAWVLTFPDSKVSLFFPPQAVLLCILLLVPTRHWWAYVLAAASAHFLATQQADWPPMYALTCEAFDALKCVAAAAGIRILIKSPLKAITLRDAILFVLIAVVLDPFGTAFWGASLPSPMVSALAIGWNGATWESRMRSRPSSWCRHFCSARTICSSDARKPCPPDAGSKRFSSVLARWRLDSSSSTQRLRVPIHRPLSYMRRFPC